jgi:hypothetical protein
MLDRTKPYCQECLPHAARFQIKYVSTDNPSHCMWHSLQQVLPNLRLLCLDVVHLAMVYEHATWRKKTPGSRFLRSVMRRSALI